MPTEPEEADNARELALKEAMAELDALTGMQAAKTQVRQLTNTLKTQLQREKLGLSSHRPAMHAAFTGSPGTGKTTVARIYAKILYGLGLLDSAKFQELDRSGLVGRYIGETEAKVTKLLNEAIDGVVFIDEAYSLANVESKNDFGHQVLAVLLKFMEDHRDRIVVIVAGYTKEMEEFFAANSGLDSRFPHRVSFEDYYPHELCTIFDGLCKKHDYQLTSKAKAKAALLLHEVYAARGQTFGNGRFVRNIFEKAVTRQGDRLAGKGDAQVLLTLTDDDIPADGALAAMTFGDLAWKWTCPQCKEPHVSTSSSLFDQPCSKCNTLVTPPWGAIDQLTLPESLREHLKELPEESRVAKLATRWEPKPKPKQVRPKETPPPAQTKAETPAAASEKPADKPKSTRAPEPEPAPSSAPTDWKPEIPKSLLGGPPGKSDSVDSPHSGAPSSPPGGSGESAAWRLTWRTALLGCGVVFFLLGMNAQSIYNSGFARDATQTSIYLFAAALLLIAPEVRHRFQLTIQETVLLAVGLTLILSGLFPSFAVEREFRTWFMLGGLLFVVASQVPRIRKRLMPP